MPGITADAGIEAIIAELEAGGGGLSFDQELQLQSLRNQGTTGAASISASAQAAIARLQQAAETGRFLFGTETEARQNVQGLAAQLTASINQILQNQGFSIPQLAGLLDPQAARLAAAEALREGLVFPTQARQELIAQASQNPSDIVRLLSLQAGREPAAGPEEELSRQLAFNLPKVTREGRTAQQRLGEAFAETPGPSLEDLIEFALAAVKPQADIGIGGFGGGGGGFGGGGGGDGGGGGGGAASAQQVARERLAQQSSRENLQRPTPRPPATTGTRAPALEGPRFSRSIQTALDAYGVAQQATTFNQDFNIAQSNFRVRIERLSATELNQLRSALFDSAVVGSLRTTTRRTALLNLLDAERRRRRTGSTATTRRGPGLQAKGGTHFEPGFFLIGEGKGGVKRGSAEFAFLAPGSVIAPMVRGERPTMDNARKAVAEMLMHGKRGGGKLRRAQGGVTVVGGDTLWAIIARLGGDPTRWPEVAKAIGLADPKNLQIGTVIPFEVLAAVGAKVPTPPAPPAPAPAPKPKAAGGGGGGQKQLTPEEESQAATVGGLETLLGGPIGDLLKEGRSLSEILRGFTLAPKPGDADTEVFRQLVAGLPEGIRNIINAPGTQFPFQTFQNLDPSIQSAVSSALGTVSGDPNILQAILGLQRGVRQKAFGGGTQLALTR